MGLTHIEAKVVGPTGITREVRFLVDSGATYSLLPPDVWQAIELKPKRKATFVLVDSTNIERSISECYIILP
ncbi:aspartyl protease family protein [Thermanaeromonas sp.]|uniref:aspartyl protease family protein n=1 Tax=Thermanaeromonas sp. TaxID=2003697 RepID=UPI002617DD39|nr:aspartyl protease family protein [Thermanaeromonas sp.]